MSPNDAEGIANSVDPDQSSLIWGCTVCPGISVRKLKINTVVSNIPGNMETACFQLKGSGDMKSIKVIKGLLQITKCHNVHYHILGKICVIYK